MRISAWSTGVLLFALTLGFLSASCSLTTDPTKASSNSTSSTSGKSETKKDGALKEEEKVSVFASANFERLKKNMAAGQGEHLAALASLLGIPGDQQAEFFAFTREKFLLVVPSEQVTSDEMVAALTREMASHPQFRNIVAKNS